MHDRNVASGDGEAYALCSPPPVLGRLRIEALVRDRNSFSGRSTLFDAAFHFPAARAGLATCPRSRIVAPGLHLQSDPEAFPNPFGSTLPPPSGLLLTSRGAFHAQNPLPGSPPGFPVCLRTPAPLRDLSIPRAQSAKSGSRRRRLPWQVARSSFAPRFAKYFVSPRNGSMFRIRYFLPDSLSLEPLGTNLIMHPSSLLVNIKVEFPTEEYSP